MQFLCDIDSEFVRVFLELNLSLSPLSAALRLRTKQGNAFPDLLCVTRLGEISHCPPFHVDTFLKIIHLILFLY